MKLKKSLILTYFLFLIILSLENLSAAGCYIDSKANCEGSGYYVVMGLSSSTNAHGELKSAGNYVNNVLCCDFGEGETACSSTLDPITNQPINKILGLSSSTNAHAEVPDLVSPAYNTYNVCYDSVENCSSTTGYCAGDEIQVITLSSDTNAHLGGYTTKICCKIVEEVCTDTCTSLGYECGTQTICGVETDCGTCTSPEVCNSTGQCVSPVTECTLTSASWSVSNAIEGQDVSLNVVGANCDGETVSFEVWESDDIGDEPAAVNPSNVVFSGTNATGTWTAEWIYDGFGQGDPEYYFIATVVGSDPVEKITSSDPELSVAKSPEDYCAENSITICGDYPEETYCDIDYCGVNATSSPPDVDCSDPDIDCYCKWTASTCGFGYSVGGGGKTCGDSTVDRPNDGNFDEQCDPDIGTSVFLPGEDSCVNLTINLGMDSYTGGSLGCTTDCIFDITGCIGPDPVCGDNVVNQLNETCDGSDLHGWTCELLGYDGGTLACTGSCELNPSGCTNPEDKICGDGNVDKPNDGNFDEQCDGTNLNGEASDCSTVDDYTNGTLACYSNCLFDYTGCTGPNPPVCGDDAVNQLNESCDGSDLQGRTCSYFGYSSGTLSCSNCKFNINSCTGGGGFHSGSCAVTQDTSYDDCEDDGWLTYSWTGVWTWNTGNIGKDPPCESDYVLDSDDNKCYYDPDGESEKCEAGGENTISCPAQLKLPFFGIYNLIAALVLIAMIYAILIRKKKEWF